MGLSWFTRRVAAHIHGLPTMDRLKSVLQHDGLPEDMSEIEVQDAETAGALSFLGSPTIRIRGLDIDLAGLNVTQAVLACR